MEGLFDSPAAQDGTGRRSRATMQDVLTIDGSTGEGGGQILRTAVTLSTALGQAVTITNIRARRRQPGLAAQHLTAVRAAGALCVAELKGDALFSTELTFLPSKLAQAGDYAFDVGEARPGGSAGAAPLILQTVLLPLVLAEGMSRLSIRGGTHLAWSPSYDFLVETWLPALHRIGIEAELSLAASGWYPVGQGRIEAVVHGGDAIGALRPVDLVDRGRLKRIFGRGVAANLPSHIAQRMTDRARALLSALDVPVELFAERIRAACPGAGTFLTAEYDHCRCGFTALGERGKSSERVAEEAAEQLVAHHRSGAALDHHLADQILLPLALASSASRFTTGRVSAHLRTNAWVLEQFGIARIAIEERQDGVGMVTVEPQLPTDRKPDGEAGIAEAEGAPPLTDPTTTSRVRTDAAPKGSDTAGHTDHRVRLDDWNVVITCQTYGRRGAARELRQHGQVARTAYPNVLVMRVEDPVAFAEALAERFAETPGLANFISRVVPAQVTFDFVDAADLEAKVHAHAPHILPQLAGKSLHIRIHRRGLKERLSSHLEEQRIGQALLTALEAAGTPGRAEFDDPDVIVSIETIDHRASLSLWTRDQRQRMPFLKLD